ncbi:MAG: hypothetical protein A3C80_00675 [Candidatus Ryanbacteria bacterium RIFCSPHIGHO2_02_FULL_45_43]|uniref:Gfo/Idh/MocA-like oxidoreductase N-terminal domain-containing protein n=1 Tax=Candidatus Ryanbacteria bacterium RIFCSPHIGHO2_01_45_13 TaxID=1802112 RepID=A0A1G2FYS1_9BACT|nr:MAG: hypothetical protein A2718_02065 [Candidatus Ryanbacteria bacterium RIFCSPHIGHO2_01_FULL_44_130]OGZ42758.1 MAG: hypothetical protein A2W41_03000 [Candidatus Ryanbacteria bacterium RIFCSPHIGHO2_01_45_13]OGZ48855.1 MAG: hypothetical protein A3C80_00675 [Candidatus Ryanbacteria bacterium RIFCSPHIGHO2_02_FULL_45_43]OGZ50887.1 MAG: hypothetical protein A3E55_02695 [Candidatus Ryanbacteria bacterium RIFCSPHIGHO2_12_FULL_44_20]OGZ52118.1 MAG: hypothetical protein A3A17_01280 [Candidatus Ryanba
MGGRWADVIEKMPDATVAAVFDTNKAKARALADKTGAAVLTSMNQLAERPDIKAALVLVPHAFLAQVSQKALEAGKHVLVEKPTAITPSELEPVLEIAKKNQLCFMPGFSSRWHYHTRLAKELVEKGEIGDLLFVRARYGFGGRKGYENEWRQKKTLSGGGELIDQGIHLIDLARWFLGDFSDVKGSIQHAFWKSDVEDNAFLILKTPKGQTAFLHASWTQWKPLFSFEIFGSGGYILLEGLGGKYGKANEELILGKRKEDFSNPSDTEQVFRQSSPLNPFKEELNEFLSAIRENRDPNPSGRDALGALNIVSKMYGEQN